MNPEIRTFPVTASELRVLRGEDGKAAPRLAGYAAKFNLLSEDLGGFREKIAPGAFTRTLAAGADVRALVEHDPSKIIGRSKANTLEVAEDGVGLLVDIQPPDTQAGRDVVLSVERGDLTQMSFAFRTLTDAWNEQDGQTIRTLLDVDLFDVSVVAYPAYQDTTVGKRSLDVWRVDTKAREARRGQARGRRRELYMVVDSGAKAG